MSPAVLRSGPYRFYFVSHDLHEPPHVHIDRDAFSAKFWLKPVALAYNLGFPAREVGGENQKNWRHGMNTSEPKAGERVRDVRFTDDAISVDLFDGRTITVPLAWYPRLLHATPEQRKNWKIAGAGYGIHWPDMDEDLTTQGLLLGAPAPRRTSKAA